MRTARPLLPWVVWGVAALAYAVAIINRSSLAALGPATQEHFGIDATTLSMFAMIQLVVYAGLQIPVGTLLDRFGSTTMILTGGLLMVAGQVIMATVADVRPAILARVLVGAFEQPPHVNQDLIVVRPVAQSSVFHTHRGALAPKGE